MTWKDVCGNQSFVGRIASISSEQVLVSLGIVAEFNSNSKEGAHPLMTYPLFSYFSDPILKNSVEGTMDE